MTRRRAQMGATQVGVGVSGAHAACAVAPGGVEAVQGMAAAAMGAAAPRDQVKGRVQRCSHCSSLDHRRHTCPLAGCALCRKAGEWDSVWTSHMSSQCTTTHRKRKCTYCDLPGHQQRWPHQPIMCPRFLEMVREETGHYFRDLYGALQPCTCDLSWHYRELVANVFPALQVVGGKLLLGHNKDMLSMSAFRSLHTVGSDYKIDQNEKLLNCETVSVVTIGGAMQILTNQKLSEVSVPKLETVGGELQFYQNNEMKTAVYMVLKSVAQRFYFYNNGQVVTVEMPSLATVGKEFRFQNNYQVKVANFKALKAVGAADDAGNGDGAFYVVENHQMQVMDFSALDSVSKGVLYVNNNYALREAVFPSLTFVSSNFAFQSNNQVELLSLPSLTKFGDVVEVRSNGRLKEIKMPELVEVVNAMYITNNAALTALKDFGKLTTLRSNIQIENNHKLQCIRGFENVTYIRSQVCVQQNSKLFMCDELADGLKKAATDNGGSVCSSFSYVPRDNCDHVCE